VTPSVERPAPARRRRSESLTPDERRAEIILAVLPLLAARGPLATSAEIADAAGVAQGTIFHVFGDKQALIDAAVRASSDMNPLAEPIRALLSEPELVKRLGAAIDLICDRLATSLPLLMKCGGTKPPLDADHPMVTLRRLLEGLLLPDAEALTHAPQQLAAMLLGLCMAVAHQTILEERAMPRGDALAALFLDGARRRPEQQ
jgi:AcrR family transcriptional regulator